MFLLQARRCFCYWVKNT